MSRLKTASEITQIPFWDKRFDHFRRKI